MSKQKTNQQLIQLFQDGSSEALEEAKALAQPEAVQAAFEAELADLKAYFANRWAFFASIDTRPVSSSFVKNYTTVIQSGSLSQKAILNLEYNKVKRLKERGGQVAEQRWLRFEASFMYRWTTIFGLTSLDIEFYNRPFPKNIGLLTNLKHLIKRKSCSKKWLDALAYLTPVESLIFNQCGLKEWPESLAALTNLKKLNISSQRLTTIPASVGALQNLQELDVSRNDLEIISPAIGNLAALEKLRLSGNQLKAIPENIAACKQLNVLDLYDNRIKKFPAGIEQLEALEELCLNANQLEQIPSSLSKLSRLKKLDLSYNRLMHIPKELGQLSNLTYFSLKENGIDRKPRSLFKKIYYFFTQSNRLYEWALPKEVLALREQGTDLVI